MANKLWQQYIKLPISKLSLWDENARFPEEFFKKTEEELVYYFLHDEKSYEIQKLATQIVDELDIPQFEPLLVYEIDGKNIVLEGNRRLTVYKLLANPKLSKDAKTQKFFQELNLKAKINNNYLLSVNITNNKDQAFRYIDRKHNKRNNEVSWTSVERGHFDYRRNKGNNKAIFKVEITRLVKGLDIDEEIKFAVLGKGFETTFWRILENPFTRKTLGFEILEDGSLKIKDKNTFNALLKIIVYNVWNKRGFSGKEIDSRNLNKSVQVSEYLGELNNKDVKKVDEDIKKRKEENNNLFGEKKLTPTSKGSSRKIYGGKELVFKCLIDPRKSLPKIESSKIIEIYKELQIIEVGKCATATYALVRIITDISIKIFLELKGYKFNDLGHLIITNGKEKNKTELKEKMNYIATKYLKSDLQRAVAALNEDLLTQNLNQVMHNAIFCASETQIRKFWKNLFPFLEYLWEEIIIIESKKPKK